MRAAAVQQPQGQPRRRRGDLLTDLSELNVAAEYLWPGHDRAASFRLFGRKHPPVRACASPLAWLTA
jgi:hypothetical protein